MGRRSFLDGTKPLWSATASKPTCSPLMPRPVALQVDSKVKASTARPRNARRGGRVEPGVKNGLLILLATLSLAACGEFASPPAATALVEGTVLASPGCPVERAASPCPAIRVSGASVVASRGTAEVARVRSASDGSFALTLPAGTYTLTATRPDGYRSSASQVVLVPATGTDSVTITLDSGIR